MKELQSDGSLSLEPSPPPKSFARFLVDPDSSWWIYAILITTAIEALLVVENAQIGPVLVLRMLLGLAVLGLIPGYLSVQILFPGDRIPIVQQFVLSVFFSVMISIAIGVALGAVYRFSGTTSVLGSSVYIFLASILAGNRRYLQNRLAR